MRARALTLVAGLLVCASGCGGTATVSGSVKFQGKPVVYGSVVILDSKNTAHSGVITPEGAYTVEGVVPGAVQIAVLSRDPAKGRQHQSKQNKDFAKEVGAQWFPLPRRLEDPATAGLYREVSSGRVQLDLDLE